MTTKVTFAPTLRTQRQRASLWPRRIAGLSDKFTVAVPSAEGQRPNYAARGSEPTSVQTCDSVLISVRATRTADSTTKHATVVARKQKKTIYSWDLIPEKHGRIQVFEHFLKSFTNYSEQLCSMETICFAVGSGFHILPQTCNIVPKVHQLDLMSTLLEYK